jgi:peptide/nickel transport system substrate-binding protein
MNMLISGTKGLLSSKDGGTIDKNLWQFAFLCITATLIVSLVIPLQALAADQDAKNASVNSGSANDAITLRAGLYNVEFPPVFNALKRPSYNQLNELYGATHVGLAVFNSDFTPNPCLADKWEISSDGGSVKFYLVKNATWQDGKPVTAQDVKFTYEYWRDNHLYRQGGWLDAYLDNVEVLDNYTGVIHLKEPYAYYFIKSLFPSVYIVPKHVWKKVEKPREYGELDGMIGCGPFIFENIDRDADTAYFKANPDYFKGKPAIDRIEWKHFRTVDSALLAIKKGEIDVIIDEPPAGVLAPSLLGEKGVTIEVGPNPGLPLLIFNYKKYPLNVTDFRKAVSYAIDYQSLVDAIEAGYGEVPGAGILPSSIVESDPNLPKLEYNLTKANDILDSLDFIDTNGDGIRNLPDGSELKFQVIAWNDQKDMRVAEMLSHMLKKAGVEFEPYTNELSVLQKMVWDDRSYDMHIDFHDPYMTALGFATIDLVPLQYGTCTDPKFSELYNVTMSAKTPEEMKAAVYGLQEYYATELPGIALYWSKSIYPYRSDRFEGWIALEGYGLTSHESWFSIKPVGE